MKFGLAEIFARWLIALALVFGFYNPSGRSFVHWAVLSDAPFSLRLMAGTVLLAGFVIFIRTTFRAISYLGVALLILNLIAIGASMLEAGLVDSSDSYEVTILVQILLSGGLAIGISWSAIRTRISGQVDSDDISRRVV